MAVRPWLHTTLRFWRNMLVLHDWQYSRLLARLNISPRGLSARPTGLHVHELGMSVPRNNSSVVPHLDDALWLGRNRGVKFTNSPHGIVANTGSLRFHITSGEELYILREVMGDGVYSFTPPQEEVVIWDIGMNVGMASLYFASQPHVRAVVGFEPFRPTFLAAQRNLALNPQLASKIDMQNFGIAARACAMDTEFDPERKGGVGTNGISPRLRQQIHVSGEPARVEHIELLAADDVLRSIRSGYPENPIVAKIDCEGSEYEIVRCLHEKGLLRELSLLMIEWHDRGPQELEAMLHDSGFATHSPAAAGGEIGMLYAVAHHHSPAIPAAGALSPNTLSPVAHGS